MLKISHSLHKCFHDTRAQDQSVTSQGIHSMKAYGQPGTGFSVQGHHGCSTVLTVEYIRWGFLDSSSVTHKPMAEGRGVVSNLGKGFWVVFSPTQTMVDKLLHFWLPRTEGES